ncbi:TonB-dependent receptor [Mucilaginibacter mali]|uniref:TonB-dependent receptor n=1 Tax=Mucilaginibacter mali TaxID=2740462 RepID=A0A7D4QB56_9SPHI|nr:outer membrane beta-barrel family protein [Mucilaginibacter mali]QKJ31365.1 TonB-dependent receptor [Mucilaginibacter mali]
MRFTILLLSLCLFFSFTTRAQSQYSVKGTAIDSAANLRLHNTTIAVLNAKDSTLRAFTRAAANGSFNIGNLNKGKFILMVTYPGYADLIERFSLDSLKPAYDMGKLNLTLKSRVLQEVLIKGTVAAMKIKGDTTEFDPKAYVIQPNSKVEDLLKQLPGIQVDKDGKITAQGKEVKKVLVDGEEFFGDDPTLVTKNIRGDMVDKVQLYDKKSDQAAFTGIDDGEKTKTINIKLKEDKKNGYFGKLDGGIATDKYYNAQAMYNRFIGKKKFSGYFIGSNTGKTGLGWDDNSKYGSSPEMQTSPEGYFYFSGGGDDDSWDGRYNGRGIPVSRTGGLHFDTKWDNDKKSINTNYKNSWLSVDGNQTNSSQNTLPGYSTSSNSNQDFNKKIFRQKIDLMYQIKLDTASTLKFNIDGTVKNSDNNDNYQSSSMNGRGDTLLNRQTRTLTNNTDGQVFNANVLFTHKFKKAGRTISVNAGTNINNSDSKGYLKSDTRFYNRTTGALDSAQVIDQYKNNVSKTANITSNATYTEPLNKMASLIFNYGLTNNHNNSDRRSYNPGAVGQYTVLDTKFSNDYTLDQLSNNFGTSLNMRTTKSTLNINARGSAVNYKQTDEINHTTLSRNFLNWNPTASYQYRFSEQRSMRFGYYGYTDQPSLEQIQPVRINTDPLNIVLGNPGLRPAFNSSFSFNYNSYKILSDQSIWINASYDMTSNAIVSNTVTDRNTNKSTSQSVNLVGKTPTSFYFNTDMGQKIMGVTFSLSMNGNGGKSYNYINNELNTTTSSNIGGNFGISKFKQNKYGFRISAGPGYAFGKTSLQPEINNNGYTFSGNGYFNVTLPGKFEINADGNYDYRGKTQSFNETFSKTIINASIVKTLLKQKNLKLTASCNDLLNQNRGFDRYANNGAISQTTYTNIKRYFMFSITWDFTQMGGPAPAKN